MSGICPEGCSCDNYRSAADCVRDIKGSWVTPSSKGTLMDIGPIENTQYTKKVVERYTHPMSDVEWDAYCIILNSLSIEDAIMVCVDEFCEKCPIELSCGEYQATFNECRVTDEDYALNPESAPDWADRYDDTLSCEGCAYEDGCSIR